MPLILSGDTGPSFVQRAAMPAGAVLQVVSVATTSVASTQGVTYVDSGLSATITPTSTSSRILVLITQSVYIYRTGSNNQARAGIRLLRNSTAILTP